MSEKSAVRSARWEMFATFVLVYAVLAFARIGMAWWSGALDEALFLRYIQSLAASLVGASVAAFLLVPARWLRVPKAND